MLSWARIGIALAVIAALAWGYTRLAAHHYDRGYDAHAAEVAEATDALNRELAELRETQRRAAEARRRTEEALHVLQGELAARAVDDPDDGLLGRERMRRIGTIR